jgi:hypothetical protein
MIKKICTSLLILVTVWGCDPIDNRLTIYNNTNNTVVPCFLLWTSNEEEYSESYLNSLEYEFSYNQIPLKSKKSITIKGNWELLFEHDTLAIIILDKIDVQKKGFNKKLRDYNIVCKIKVSKQYIKKNNWQIDVDSLNSHKFVKL